MSASVEGMDVPAHLRAAARVPAPPSDASAKSGRSVAAASLRAAAVSLFVVVALGQLLFAGYIVGFYGRTAWQGHFELWNRVLPHGYVAGDGLFNLVLGLHLALAVVITVGGLLQLVPPIRRALPAFHRWTGRTYLLAAAITGSGGLVMVWGRGAAGDLSQHIAISINALLVLGCVAMAWKHAHVRRIDQHRRWALRLFLCVSGVWFFRVGLMFWIVVNHGPTGFDPETFSGPFLTALAITVYIALPLSLLELYFLAQRGRSAAGKFVMAGGLALLTLMMAVGVAAAAAFMWLPRL